MQAQGWPVSHAPRQGHGHGQANVAITNVIITAVTPQRRHANRCHGHSLPPRWRGKAAAIAIAIAASHGYAMLLQLLRGLLLQYY